MKLEDPIDALVNWLTTRVTPDVEGVQKPSPKVLKLVIAAGAPFV
jgi:hypothetical protein